MRISATGLGRVNGLCFGILWLVGVVVMVVVVVVWGSSKVSCIPTFHRDDGMSGQGVESVRGLAVSSYRWCPVRGGPSPGEEQPDWSSSPPSLIDNSFPRVV